MRVVRGYRPLLFLFAACSTREIVPQNCFRLQGESRRYYLSARRCNRASENVLEAEICLFSTPSRCAIIIAVPDTSGNGCKYERKAVGPGEGSAPKAL